MFEIDSTSSKIIIANLSFFFVYLLEAATGIIGWA